MKQWLIDFLKNEKISLQEGMAKDGGTVVHLTYETNNCENLHFRFRVENFVNNVLEYWKNFTLNNELKKTFEAILLGEEELSSEIIKRIQTEYIAKYNFLTNLIPKLIKAEQINRTNEECIAIYKKVFTKYGWEIIEEGMAENKQVNNQENKQVVIIPLPMHNTCEDYWDFEASRCIFNFGKSEGELNDIETEEVEQMLKEINNIADICNSMAQKLKF